MTTAAERPAVRASNAYSPEMQKLEINLHEVVADDLKPLGKIIDINGFMASTPEHGVFMDDVEIVVEHPRMRIPILLKANWNSEIQSVVYRHNYPVKESHFDYYKAVLSREYIPQRGFTPMNEYAQEVTSTVMDRLDRHPVWEMYRKSQQRHFFAPQHRAWMKATEEWNRNGRKTFSNAFENEHERGVFMNALLSLCQHKGVSNISDLSATAAAFTVERKLHIKGISSAKPVADFDLSRKVPRVARGGLVWFRATLDFAGPGVGGSVIYDGSTLFTSWSNKDDKDGQKVMTVLPL